MPGTKSEPVGEGLRLDEMITGIASDLVSLRAGGITIEDARVRAEMAKQYLAGVRMIVTARKYLQENARLIGSEATDP